MKKVDRGVSICTIQSFCNDVWSSHDCHRPDVKYVGKFITILERNPPLYLGQLIDTVIKESCASE